MNKHLISAADLSKDDALLILDTAEELFGNQGYRATSLQQVAERCEFSVGALYQFFAGKEELFALTLVDYLADRFAAVGTPAECIKKLEAAAEAGARQFWMSVHFDDKERFLRDWAAKVAPAFR